MRMMIALALIILIALFQIWWFRRYGNKKHLNLLVSVIIPITLITAGLTLFYPQYKMLIKPQDERWTSKKSPVGAVDIEVLLRAKSYLSEESYWDKNDLRYCLDWQKKSLFCAVALAEKEFYGKYRHGGVAIQHIRFTIDEQYPMRWKRHPIQEFNNHPDTNYHDVIQLIDDTIANIKKRLVKNPS